MGGLGLISRRRAIASSPTAGKGVDDLLAHLIFRWSIKEQGATNESLAANPTLIDFAGNGFDLPLTGFTYDGTTNGIMTDEQGEKFLRFSARPACYGHRDYNSLGFPMSQFADYTIIAKRKWQSEGRNEWLLRIFGGSSNYYIAALENNASKTEKYCRSIGHKDFETQDISDLYNPDKSIVYQVTDSYNGLVELPYAESYYDNLGYIRIGNTASANKGVFDLYDMLFFDMKLTDKEIESIIRYFEL